MSGRALETLAKGGLLAATAKESRQEQEPTDFVLEARRGTAECVLPLSLSLSTPVAVQSVLSAMLLHPHASEMLQIPT